MIAKKGNADQYKGTTLKLNTENVTKAKLGFARNEASWVVTRQYLLDNGVSADVIASIENEGSGNVSYLADSTATAQAVQKGEVELGFLPMEFALLYADAYDLEIVAAAGKEIGIDISTYFPEDNSFYDDMTTCNFDIIMWSAPGAGPMSPYSKAMFYFSEEYAKIASNWSGNFGHYMNDDAEAILQKIPLETDEAKLKEYYTELSKLWLEEVPSVALMYRPEQFYSVNESVWTNFPAADDGRNIPPLMCTDGYGIAALYDLELAE